MRFQDYFIPCVISSIQAYYRSRSSCLSLLSFLITSGSCIVCNGTLTIKLPIVCNSLTVIHEVVRLKLSKKQQENNLF